ncbi:MAG: DUF58 domain-containing protein [Lachnospiraceae bacterium]|nr:DUF58 domain-containing protein [Lachnospiraceae bacterium]
MIRNRFIWLFLFAASLVGISFYGGAVSYGFFFVMLFIPIVSLIYLLVVYLTFKIYERVDKGNIMAGETTPYYFTLQNEGFTGFSSIRVIFFSTFSKVLSIDDKREYELYPGEGIRKDTFLVCKYRGEYEVGIKRVEITDFFRLFLFSYKNKETVRLQIKPAIVHLNDLSGIDIDVLSYRDSTVNVSEPDLPVREYVAGDDVRRIHWKKTASTGSLMVRTITGEEKQGISIVIPGRRISEDEFVYIPCENRVLEAAVAVTLLFAGRNIPSDIYLTEGEPVNVRNLEGFNYAYEQIANVSFDADFNEDLYYDRLLYSGNIARSKLAFFFVSSVPESLQVLFERLKKENVAVVCYVVGDFVDKRPDSQGIRYINLPLEDKLTEVM